MLVGLGRLSRDNINKEVILVKSIKFIFLFDVLVIGVLKYFMKIFYVKIVKIRLRLVKIVISILFMLFSCMFIIGSFVYLVCFLFVFCFCEYFV